MVFSIDEVGIMYASIIKIRNRKATIIAIKIDSNNSGKIFR